ncbi:MAG TPA: hypothetical protein VGC89_11085 [Pyrinomonadaceae bacterium]
MSQKPKRGLQRGLSEIVEKQTAPIAEKTRQSADLISRFADREPQAATPSPTSRGVTPPDPKRPTAPERNYNKRANSLDKLALPAGIFQGSSKALYDALYVRTRGAVAPTRQVRATKRELSEWSGIRNVKTIDSHLRYFSAIGLVISEWERGQNDGALYEVLLPEETSGLFVRSRGVTPPDPTLPHVTPPDVGSPQNLGSPHPQNMGSPHLTQGAIDTTVYENPKTSFKTNTENDDDDAALAGLIATIKTASKEITGKELSAAESDRWKEFAEVLMAELKIAAARTTISSVPAFMAEHLRRRLWKIDRKQARAEGRELPDEVVAQTASVDASKCPDCGGSGWWYPEGEGKGVAKCRHEKLASEN